MSNTFKDKTKHSWKDRMFGEYDEWDKNKVVKRREKYKRKKNWK